MKWIATFLLLLSVVLAINANAQVQRSRSVLLMGCEFNITIVDKDSLSAEQYIDLAIAEITRIENLISEWRPYTQISEVNQNAGIRPVKVDREVLELTRTAIFFSEITDGAFDISIAAMDKIWRFDGQMDEMPTEESIKKSIQYVGYQNIVIDTITSEIFLKKQGMKIGFGSIGKGYAAENARSLMQSKGVVAGIIDASGDITTWGTQANGKPWRIGATNPFKNKVTHVISITESAVTTSGSYEKFVEFNGKRYSHIINPKTGYPSEELTSVTVVGLNAEIANGISTSIMVLGKDKGLLLIKNFPLYACLMITDKGKLIRSKNFGRIGRR